MSRDRAPAGFTAIELVAVLVVVAALAAMTVPALASLGTSRAAAAARQVQRDLGYSRQRAVATGTRTWVVFEPSAERYSVLAESQSMPGRASATVLADPASGRDFVQELSTGALAATGIVSASFDGAPEIGFDWIGAPLNSAESPLAGVGTVALSGGWTVSVAPTTGLVTLTP